MDPEHQIAIVATPLDGLIINMQTKEEFDIDEYFEIADIKNMIYKHGYFFLMANKRQNKLGYYLLKINRNSPLENKGNKIALENQYIIN